jgi:hypothetical protein
MRKLGVEEATAPIQEIKGSPTKPKKSKETNKAKGGKKTEIKNTPAKASPTSSPPKKRRKVWRVKRASSESSTPRPDKPKIN